MTTHPMCPVFFSLLFQIGQGVFQLCHFLRQLTGLLQSVIRTGWFFLWLTCAILLSLLHFPVLLSIFFLWLFAESFLPNDCIHENAFFIEFWCKRLFHQSLHFILQLFGRDIIVICPLCHPVLQIWTLRVSLIALVHTGQEICNHSESFNALTDLFPPRWLMELGKEGHKFESIRLNSSAE